jgi:hypothetical protein
VLLQQQVEEQQKQAAAQLQEAAQERQAELGRMQVGALDAGFCLLCTNSLA